MTTPRAGRDRATSISREKIEKVPIVVHAQILSITRVLRSLGPRSEGETAYSPAFPISGVTPESKPAGWVSPIAQPIHNFCPTGKSLELPNCGVSRPLRKNILIFRNGKSVYMFAIPSHSEGRCANVTDAGRAAVDAEGALDESA